MVAGEAGEVRRQPDLAIYAINLDRSADRFEGLARSFGGQGRPLIRVSALDAREDPASVLGYRGKTLRDSRWVGWDYFRQRPYSITEEACFCGHLLALERFLGDGGAYALILEDDAVPVSDWADLLDEILTSGLSFDILKLEGVKHRGARLVAPLLKTGSHYVVRSWRPAAGSAAYLVTRKAAQKMLEKGRPITTVFDYFLISPGVHGLNVLYAAPWIVRQAGGPSLQVERSNDDPKRSGAMNGIQLLRRLGHRLSFLAEAIGGDPVAWLRARRIDWGGRT